MFFIHVKVKKKLKNVRYCMLILNIDQIKLKFVNLKKIQFVYYTSLQLQTNPKRFVQLEDFA